jgi:hypothetical protein
MDPRIETLNQLGTPSEAGNAAPTIPTPVGAVTVNARSLPAEGGDGPCNAVNATEVSPTVKSPVGAEESSWAEKQEDSVSLHRRRHRRRPG